MRPYGWIHGLSPYKKNLSFLFHFFQTQPWTISSYLSAISVSPRINSSFYLPVRTKFKLEGRPAGPPPITESLGRQIEISGFCILKHHIGSFFKCSQFRIEGSSSQAFILCFGVDICVYIYVGICLWWCLYVFVYIWFHFYTCSIIL